MQTQYIDLKQLNLDFDNPRFSNFDFKTEDEIINYLTEYENINELINSITTNGYISLGEPLIVLRNTDTNYTVLEGNRRIAALKSMITRVAQDTIPDKIRCDIVENRKDALFKISSKHITGMKKWSAIEKKQFYENHFIRYKTNGLSTTEAIKEISAFTSDSEYIIQKDISSLNFARNVYNSTKRKHAELGPLSHIESDIITGRIYNRLTELLDLELNNDTLAIDISDGLSDIFNSILYAIGRSLWVDKTLNTRLINTNKDFNTALKLELLSIGEGIDKYKDQKLKMEEASCLFNIDDEFPIDSAHEEKSLNDITQEDNENPVHETKPKQSGVINKKDEKTDRIRLAAINEHVFINKLPFNLDSNIKLSINDNLEEVNSIKYTSQSDGNIFIDDSKIISTSKNGTYTLDAEFQSKKTSFTVTINVPSATEINKLVDSDWFYMQCENLSFKPHSEKIIKTLTILHYLDLNDELDRMVAAPLLRSIIEYSLRFYKQSESLKVNIDDNLPGSFNNILQIINDKYDVYQKNQIKQIKTVKNNIENLNPFIHDYLGIASGTLLSDLFAGAKPVLEFIYNFEDAQVE